MKIIQIPAENGLGKTKGTNLAPKILSENLKSIEIKINNKEIDKQQKIIFQESLKILKSNKQTLFIGGDHSISYPLVRAFLKHCHSQKTPQEPFLIVFDAHPDCMPPMKEPTHEEWLSAIIEEGFPTKNIILIGIRKVEPEEKKFLKKHKIKIMKLKQIEKLIKLAQNKTCYLSFDIDSLDPSLVSATGYPEPKGLQKTDTLHALKKIKENTNLKAIDLVEINPTLLNSKKTINLAIEILDLLNN